MLQIKKSWFTNPWVMLVSIIIGLGIGINDSSLTKHLASIGQLYLALIGMCILPIMITAIISSLGRLLSTKNISSIVKRLILFLIGSLVIAAVIGILLALIAKPGVYLNAEAKYLLSQRIGSPLPNALSPPSSGDFIGFLFNIVPTNIFTALSQGNNLAVLFFSILLGVALGLVSSEAAKKTLDNLHVFYLALLKIVDWIMYGLPLGLCFLFTGYASQINLAEIQALARLLAVIFVGAFLLLAVCSLLVWRHSELSYFKSIAVLKTPLLVAFGSCSSFAAIPAMIHSLEQGLKIKRELVELLVPLGINLLRPASILRYTSLTVFIAQLYGQDLSLAQLGILVVASILTGMAASSIPGIVSVSMIAFILQPLGLPSALGIVLFIIITPVIDPIITLVNTYSNCALAVLVSGAKNRTNGKRLQTASL